MDHLRVTLIGGAHGVLDGGRRETLFEETVHVAAEDRFQQGLLFEPGDEGEGGSVGPLLHLAVAPLLPGRIGAALVESFGDFQGNAGQVGAVAAGDFQLGLAEFRRIERNVA